MSPVQRRRPYSGLPLSLPRLLSEAEGRNLAIDRQGDTAVVVEDAVEEEEAMTNTPTRDDIVTGLDQLRRLHSADETDPRTKAGYGRCPACNWISHHPCEIHSSCSEAIELIESLEADNAKLTRQRDEAIRERAELRAFVQYLSWKPVHIGRTYQRGVADLTPEAHAKLMKIVWRRNDDTVPVLIQH